MTPAKFKVDEVVIIHTPRLQVHGTETVVVDAYWSDNTPSITTGEIMPAGWFYKTETESDVGSPIYMEMNLRKKHEPSELSFKELMTSIKQPNVELIR